VKYKLGLGLLFLYIVVTYIPVGKIAEKAVYRSVFFTTWHCIFSAELTKKRTSLDCFLAILPTGIGRCFLCILI